MRNRFGTLLNMVYVMDREGRVAYPATRTLPDKVERALEGVLA